MRIWLNCWLRLKKIVQPVCARFSITIPRKNLKKQIEAFKKFITDNKTDLKYALTGFKNSFSNDILEILNDPILKNRVIFLGFVDIEKLKCLLTYSSALLY